MAKQNFGAGTGVPSPPRQGEKGGRAAMPEKRGRSMDPGEKGDNAGVGKSDSEKQNVGRAHKGRP